MVDPAQLTGRPSTARGRPSTAHRSTQYTPWSPPHSSPGVSEVGRTSETGGGGEPPDHPVFLEPARANAPGRRNRQAFSRAAGRRLWKAGQPGSNNNITSDGGSYQIRSATLDISRARGWRAARPFCQARLLQCALVKPVLWNVSAGRVRLLGVSPMPPASGPSPCG